MKEGAILLLEAANLVHVDRVEVAFSLLLISRELFIAHWLKAHGSILADADDKNASALGAAGLVVLVGKGNVNLRHVVGRMRRRPRVRQHRLAITTDDDGARPAIVFGLDGKAKVLWVLASVKLGVAVGRKNFVTHTLLHTVTTEKEETRNEHESEEDDPQDQKKRVDHVVTVATVGRQVVKRVTRKNAAGQLRETGNSTVLGGREGRWHRDGYSEEEGRTIVVECRKGSLVLKGVGILSNTIAGVCCVDAKNERQGEAMSAMSA